MPGPDTTDHNCGDPECAAGGDHGEPWRCLAHKKRRDAKGRKVPCKARRVRGTRICRMHGVNDAVRKTARDRLLEGADAAAALLVKAVERADQMGAWLHPSALRAANLILDRTGHGPKSELEITAVARQNAEAVTAVIRSVLRRFGADPGEARVAGAVREELERLERGQGELKEVGRG